jgi:hypothetical protein
VRPLALTTHDTIEVPKDAELFGTDGIFPEDVAVSEIGLEAFQDDYVGRDDQESLGVVFRNFVRFTAWLKYCQAMASAITFVLPLPVAILVQ